MRTFCGYRVLYSGAVLLVLCYCLCVLAEEKVHRAAGSSLVLPLGYPKENFSFVQWKYENKVIASYRNGQIRITKELQFSGRLKVDNNTLSVEVTDLQLNDSGSYSVVADKTGVQLPTRIISLTVYDVFKIDFTSTQTWKESTNSCEVHLLCRAPEDQKLSFTWSGFKNGSGVHLKFFLSPADGDVTLNCTAMGSFGRGSNTIRVMCKPTEKPDSGNDMLLIWIAVGGGAAVLLLLTIMGVSCWWKLHKERSTADTGNTLYADVNIGSTVRKETINVSSIYESVDESRIASDQKVGTKPQTLYDTVTFARPALSGPSMSSPYQEVL